MLFRRTLMLLVAALLLGACGGGGQPAPNALDAGGTPAAVEPSTGEPPPTDGPVTITFGGGEWERGGYQKLIDRFNSENTDVRVQFVSLDSVYMGGSSNMDQQLRQIASMADTATTFTLTREAIRRGFFTDLAPLIEADNTFDRADFYPGALEAGSSGSGIYMVPRTMSLQLVSYNKDLWDRAGLGTPKPDWTWEELLASAQQIARKRGDTVEVYGMIDWGGITILEGLLAQSNLSLLDTPAGQGRFDQPELLAALERLGELSKSGAVLVPGGEGQIMSPQEQIQNQEVGLWWNGMFFNGLNGLEPSFSIGTLPAPRGMGGVQRNVQGYVMSSGTQHPDAAWRWLSFLSRQQVEQGGGMMSVGGDLPARKSVAEGSGYWNRLDEETRTAVEATLAAPAAPGMFSFDSDYLNALSSATNQVVTGKQTAEAALREASESYDRALARTQQTPTPDDAGPIVVATPKPEVVAAEGAVKVRFGTFGFDQGELRKLADEFNQSQSEVFVEIVEPDRSGGQMLRLDFAYQAANSDAFTWYGLPDANELTATLDLQPLIDADPDFAADDYPAALLAAFQQDGKLIGLPQAIDLRVVQYNPKLFEEAGLEPPTSDWTLEQYIDAAQRLTSGEEPNKQYGFTADGTLGLEFVLEASGVSVMAGQGDQLRPNYTDPEVVEAVRRFIDLTSTASPSKELTGYRGGGIMIGSFDTVRQGRVGIWLSFGMPGEFGGPVTDVGIAAPPLSQSGMSADNFSFSGLFISANATDPQATWKWVKFLSQSTGGLRGRFPARTSVVQSDEFMRQAPPGAAEVYRAYSEALAKSPPTAARDRRSVANFERYWFFRAVDQVLRGEERDLEQALADAQTLTEQYLDCVRAGDTTSNCAKQVDPTYDGFMVPAAAAPAG
ncbi:MAG TPA: extracellular solute-binding protein [Roseiflexaceae bacterium]|nr:extracellular solute-binding protein [Roseiflexaceae bacterium]